MGVIEPAPPTNSTLSNLARGALRRANAERQAAKARHDHIKRAEELGREVHSAAERVLFAFSDVELGVVQYRIEEFKRAATGLPLPAFNLPDGLIARRAMREEAQKQVITAKATHESLVTDLIQAESAVREAAQKVASAAVEVLVAEGARQAGALKEAWDEVWRHYDRLSALADCRLDFAEASFPVALPQDIVVLLQSIAELDDRDFVDGLNDAAKYAGEAWCSWFESLLTDAEAEVTFKNEDATDAGLAERALAELARHSSV